MVGAFGSFFGVMKAVIFSEKVEARREEADVVLPAIRALGGGDNKAARMGAAQSGADQPNIAYPTGSPSDLGDEEAWRQAVLAEYAKLKNDGNEVGASTLAMQHPAALAAHWVGPTPNGVAMAPPPFDVSDGAVAKAPTSSFQFAPPPPPMGMVPQTPLSGLREEFKQHCAVQDAAALFGTWPADQYGSNSFGFNPAAGAAPPPQVPDRHRSSRNPPPPNAPAGVYPNGGGAQQASISMPPHTAATLGIERPPMPLQGVHPLQPQAHPSPMRQQSPRSESGMSAGAESLHSGFSGISGIAGNNLGDFVDEGFLDEDDILALAARFDPSPQNLQHGGHQSGGSGRSTHDASPRLAAVSELPTVEPMMSGGLHGPLGPATSAAAASLGISASALLHGVNTSEEQEEEEEEEAEAAAGGGGGDRADGETTVGGSKLPRPCTGCRTSKVLCDRSNPCGRCTRLGIECTVPKTVPRGRPSLQRVAERARLAKEAEAQAKKAGGKAAAKKAPAAEKPAAAEKEAAEVVDKKGAVATTETKEVVEKGAGRLRKDRGGGAEAAEPTYEEFGELLNSSRRRDSQRNRTWHDEDE